MASDIKIGAAARTAMIDALADLLDAGGGAAYIGIRTGAPPATPATADSGTLLATLPMSATAFGAGSSGTAIAATITSDTDADASGDAGHFRIYDFAGVCHLQGTAGVAGDTPDLTFSVSKAIVAGGTVSISSLTMTMPEQ